MRPHGASFNPPGPIAEPQTGLHAWQQPFPGEPMVVIVDYDVPPGDDPELWRQKAKAVCQLATIGPDMAVLLLELEWASWSARVSGEAIPKCAVCGALEHNGHAADCALHALLERIRALGIDLPPKDEARSGPRSTHESINGATPYNEGHEARDEAERRARERLAAIEAAKPPAPPPEWVSRLVTTPKGDSWTVKARHGTEAALHVSSVVDQLRAGKDVVRYPAGVFCEFAGPYVED